MPLYSETPPYISPKQLELAAKMQSLKSDSERIRSVKFGRTQSQSIDVRVELEKPFDGLQDFKDYLDLKEIPYSRTGVDRYNVFIAGSDEFVASFFVGKKQG